MLFIRRKLLFDYHLTLTVSQLKQMLTVGDDSSSGTVAGVYSHDNAPRYTYMSSLRQELGALMVFSLDLNSKKKVTTPSRTYVKAISCNQTTISTISP